MDVEASGGRVDIKLQKRPKGEVVAFGKLMAALATMKAKDALNGFQVELYEDATAHVPLAVLGRVVGNYLQTPELWRPDPGDLVGACEAMRVELRKGLVFEPCPLCAHGWIEFKRDGYYKFMARCACWKAHQAKVEALNVGTKPLALPPAGNFTAVGEIE